MRKRFVAWLLALCMVLGGGLAAVAEDVDTKALYEANIATFADEARAYYGAKGEAEKIAAYDEPVTVKCTNFYNAALETAMGKFGSKYGESFDWNRWSDVFKNTLNVNLQYKWWAADADYNTKLRLDMTAGDLPDIFIVRQQSDLVQLAEAGLIWDLTDLFDTWAASDDKESLASDGGALVKMATVDDRVYALPAGLSDTDNFSYLWLRKDWMEALELEAPTTMDELRGVMEAFAKADFDGNGQDDTVGMVLDKDLYYSLRGLFSGYDAYPEIWVPNEAGDGVVWGGTQESCKEALTFLNELYQDGLIDPEFVTHSRSDAMEAVLNGKCGVYYGGHWEAHTMGNLHAMDENSDWMCVDLPSVTGEAVRSPLIPSGSWIAVNKNFAHPELVFKLMALSTFARVGYTHAPWFYYEESVTWHVSPVRGLVSALDNLITYRVLQECYDNGRDESKLWGKAVTYWGNLNGPAQWEWELMFGPGENTPMTVLDRSERDGRLFYNAYLGVQSDYMLDRWSTIRDEQAMAFTKIIIGEIGVEEGFAAWLDTFDKMGGARITEECSEWYREADSE